MPCAQHALLLENIARTIQFFKTLVLLATTAQTQQCKSRAILVTTLLQVQQPRLCVLMVLIILKWLRQYALRVRLVFIARIQQRNYRVHHQSHVYQEQQFLLVLLVCIMGQVILLRLLTAMARKTHVRYEQLYLHTWLYQ
jgi:hypothetical protein